MQVRIGWLALGQFVGRYAQRPDVRLEIIRVLLDDLGRHPEGRAHKRVALAHRLGQLLGHAEVRQFYVALFGQEHVGCLYVTMNFALVVQVVEAFRVWSITRKKIIFLTKV